MLILMVPFSYNMYPCALHQGLSSLKPPLYSLPYIRQTIYMFINKLY
jgi:hypothetical protein